MDNLSEVLAGHHGRDAFALRCDLDPPWSMLIEDRATVGLVVVLVGTCVLQRDGESPIWLHPGDVAVIKGPRSYTLADHPDTPVGVVIEPGQICRTVEGDDVSSSMSLGLRSWGNAQEGQCTFFAAAYELPSQVRGRLLPAVPDLVVLKNSGWQDSLIKLLSHELASELPGQDAMLNRLVDLILIAALREWFARPDAHPPIWWNAQADPVVGRALSLMHSNPEHPWTLSSVAAQIGYSRATLARRFSEVLHQPPMAYLTEWRLALAADLLQSTDSSIEQIAHQVGYTNAFAFSSAFKRAYDQPPRDYRNLGVERRVTRSTSSML